MKHELANLFRSGQPDVVHAHGGRSALPVALLPASRRPAFVYTVHGFHYTAKSPLPRAAARFSERYCIARADAAVMVSRSDLLNAEHERFRSPSPLRTIYNGVAVPPGLKKPEAERDFDIAYIARLHRQKDPLILPKILLAMRPLRPTLLIVGSGDLEHDLRRKIDEAGVKDQVTWLPAMPRERVLAILASARTFLLPSLWEGLPISLAEAMQLDVAVVASDVAGNREIVEDGRTGLLAPASDAAAFAGCIERLLGNSSLRAALVAAGRDYATATFSPTRQCHEHLALYESILAARDIARKPRPTR